MLESAGLECHARYGLAQYAQNDGECACIDCSWVFVSWSVVSSMLPWQLVY